MFNAIGPVEMLVIFIIVLMVFGADKIPELARGLGKGIREFKKAANMVRNEILSETDNLKIENPIKKEIDEISNSIKTDPTLNMDFMGEEEKKQPQQNSLKSQNNQKNKISNGNQPSSKNLEADNQ